MTPEMTENHDFSKFLEMSRIFGKSSAAAIFLIFFGPAGGSRTLTGAFAPDTKEHIACRDGDFFSLSYSNISLEQEDGKLGRNGLADFRKIISQKLRYLARSSVEFRENRPGPR